MATEELNLNIYDFIPKSLRTADIEQGLSLLQRYLAGPQQIWQTIHQKVFSLIDTFDPDEIEDRMLQWRKDTVGLTKELSYLTEDLTDDNLRRLVRLSMLLWRLRGARPGIKQSLFAMTGRHALVYDWFDQRFEISVSGLQFLRQPTTDSLLLGKESVEQLEGVDGQTSFFNQRIFTSGKDFADARVVGGERLYLDSELPDPATRIIEDFEADFYVVGQFLQDAGDSEQGGKLFAKGWTNNVGGSALPGLKVQNTDVFSGTKALTTIFEEGIPPHTGSSGPVGFVAAASMMQGGKVEDQRIDLRFKFDPSWPGTTVSGLSDGIFMFPIILMLGGAYSPLAGIAYDRSSDQFLLIGFYSGEPGGTAPPTAVPKAYILDGAFHKLTVKLDLSGTYYTVELDDGAYTFSALPSEIKPLGESVFAFACVGLHQLVTGAVFYDMPNIKLDRFEYGFYDPSLDNGVYTVQKRIDANTLRIKEFWNWGKTQPNHFYIVDDFSEYNTDIHLDASGELDRDLVRNLLELQRAPSETFTVFLWNFLDTFEALNRWQILFEGDGIEIKEEEDGETYVELLGGAEPSVIICSVLLPEDGTVKRTVFESTFEFTDVAQLEDTVAANFAINALESSLQLNPNFYLLRVTYERENSTGQFYIKYSIAKLTDGVPSNLWDYSSATDVVLRQPQIAPGVKHLLRMTVEKREDGANEINLWIDGTHVTSTAGAPTAVDSINPFQVGGSCAIINDNATGILKFKAYDMKFSELPIETIFVARSNAILQAEAEPVEPVPPVVVETYEDFENFTAGNEIFGAGFYGTLDNMLTYPVIGDNTWHNWVCTDEEAYTGNQCAEAQVAGVELAPDEVYRTALILETPVQTKIDLNRNTISSTVAFKGVLPVAGTNFEGVRFKTILHKWNVDRLAATYLKASLRYDFTLNIWRTRIWLADGSGGQVLAKEDFTDLSAYLDGNWHTFKAELDREGTFARIDIDDGAFTLEVTDTEFPAMLPFNEKTLAVGHQLVFEAAATGSIIPSGASFFIDAWQLDSEDYQETFESYPVAGVETGIESFYGAWQSFGFPGTELFQITDAYSRPGGKQSILADYSTPIPAGESRLCAPAQLLAGGDYLPGQPKFDLLKEHVRQTFWFKIPVLTSLPIGTGPSILFISLFAGEITGGGSDIDRTVWCLPFSTTDVRLALLDAFFGDTPTWIKYLPGFEVYCDGNEHKLEIDFWRTTNNLLMTVKVDDILFGSIDQIEAPAMSPWTSKLNLHLLLHGLDNQANPSPWPGVGADGYFDNLLLESFDT